MISNYLAHKILDHVLGGPDYTRPTTVYIALFTTMPDNTGASAEEPIVGSYARLAVTNDTDNWQNAAGREKLNEVAFEFLQASADWGVCLGAGIYDALSGGNLLFYGLFGTSMDVTITNIVTFEIGAFKVSGT